MTKPALNPKQTRFTQEYAIDFNATQAAIRAGYSKKNAESIGYQLLQKTPVQAAIKKSMDKTAAKSDISVQWVLDGLKTIAVKGEREKDYSAANRSLELIGKHIGMFVERTQEIDPAVPTKIILQEIDGRTER